MDSDHLNSAHENASQKWYETLSVYNTSGIEKLASKYRQGKPCTCVKILNGSFNFCFKVVFQLEHDTETTTVTWAVRFPIPGQVMYPEEKVRREFAVMKFLREKTSIPIPRVIAFGTSADNHDPRMGPFIITEWVEGVPLNTIMEELPRPEDGPKLRKDITDQQLYDIYVQVARVLLELSSCTFDKIGALEPTYEITSGPMTLKLNEIERGGYVKIDDHSLPPYTSAVEYMRSLVKQSMSHLEQQLNSVDNEKDAREKYILRRRLEHLVRHFTFRDFENGPFVLFCDDFRPGNVLVHEETLQITAVVDWEWAYAAPYEFLFSPPSWLILQNPSMWTIQDETAYHSRFSLFLEALKQEEMKREKIPGASSDAQPVSSLMCQSMEQGTFWFNDLIRRTFTLDEKNLVRDNIESVLKEKGLLNVGLPDEKEVEAFVTKKMEDLRQYNSALEAVRKGEDE